MTPEEEEEDDKTGDMSAESVKVSEDEVVQDGDIHPGCWTLREGSG